MIRTTQVNKYIRMITKLVYGKKNPNSSNSNPNLCFSLSSCPNCDTWVVNLSDHLRKTHRIASPVDRKPLLRMARLEKRRMTESVTNPSSSSTTTTTTTTTSSGNRNLLSNGLPTSNNEIENLLFKHEQDASPQFTVTLPENILLNHSMPHFTSPPNSTNNKRTRPIDEQTSQLLNGPFSPNKKSRLDLMDNSKLSTTNTKSTKKNRNKANQQTQSVVLQQQPPQTIIKTAASGIFPQQPILPLQQTEETSDDVNHLHAKSSLVFEFFVLNLF